MGSEEVRGKENYIITVLKRSGDRLSGLWRFGTDPRGSSCWRISREGLCILGVASPEDSNFK